MASLVIKNCIKIKQNDIPLYIFTLNAGEVYNNFEVSRRYEDKEKGYQRIVKDTKIKKIVSYLSGKSENSYPSLLPNSILIALDNINFNTNTLTINDEDGTKGLIIDGQHRLKGAYEYDINFPLIIIGIGGLEPKYQARLFITINKTQTSLPSALYLDLISATSDEDIRANLDGEVITSEQKATELVKDLNRDESSSLKDLIAETGEERGKINLSQLVGIIKKYINYTDGKFKGYSYNDQLKILINYFNAIKVVFENDWDEKILFKTTILGGLLKAIDGVFDVVNTIHNNFKENSIIYVLSNVQELNLNELANSVGGGIKAQDSFAKRFIKEVKDKIKDDNKYKVDL
jgi:DGQHR domain-containing protein